MANKPAKLPTPEDVLAKIAKAGVDEDMLRAALTVAFTGVGEANQEFLKGAERKQKLAVVRRLRKHIRKATRELRPGPVLIDVEPGTQVQRTHVLDPMLDDLIVLGERLDTTIRGIHVSRAILHAAAQDVPFSALDAGSLALDLRKRVKKQGAKLTYRELAVLLVSWPPAPGKLWDKRFQVPEPKNEKLTREAVNLADEWLRKTARRCQRAKNDVPLARWLWRKVR